MASKEEKQDAQAQQLEQIQMDPSFFYKDDHIETEFQDSRISSGCLGFHEIFGFDCLKRYNLHILDDNHIIYVAGITYQILNIQTGDKRIFFSKDFGGIGSIAVNVAKTHFAVAEKGNFPNIYIYEYPSLKLYRILRRGTERSYSNICFSHTGETLASVGSYPDYMLTVWFWKHEQVQLKTKAFSQEIFKVTFSEYYEDVITTSGTGHIRFWKIANTFTGLKLKGDIAKFGQTELSDITAYYDFPDGKVLSGTEYGHLLLWEGNFIKVVLQASDNNNPSVLNPGCHEKEIEVIFKHNDSIVTAGSDGYLKFWDFKEIDQCEGDDFCNYFIKPTREILIKNNEEQVVSIVTVARHEKFWIIQDSFGKYYQMDTEDFNYVCIRETTSGKIASLGVCEMVNAAVTLGENSTLSLFDFVNKREFYKRQFPAKGTCLQVIPYNPRNKGRLVVAGFSNGIVRFLLINQQGFHLIHAVKVHPFGIQYLSVSSDGLICAVCDVKGNIFFLQLHQDDLQKIEPFCLFETGFNITSITWNRNCEKILIGTKQGMIHEIPVPKMNQCDFSETYKQDFTPKSYTIKMMESQKPKKDEMSLEYMLKKNKGLIDEVEVEWTPDPILSVCYYNADESKIIASVDGKFLGHLYIIPWDNLAERPILSITISQSPCRYLRFVENYDVLIIGQDDGCFQLRHRYDFQNDLLVQGHDVDNGSIVGVQFNYEKNALISASQDGTVLVKKIDIFGMLKQMQKQYLDEYEIKDLQNGLNENTFSEEVPLQNLEQQDILDDTIYSIQQQKLLAEEDQKKSYADKQKQKVRYQIKQLVSKFQNIYAENEKLDGYTKLTENEMVVDAEYQEILEKRVAERYEEAQKELAWDLEYATLKKSKLQNYMMDELSTNRTAVRAIKNPEIQVKTFKVKKLSKFLRKNLSDIYKLIDEEASAQQQLNQNFGETKNSNFPNKTNQSIGYKKTDDLSKTKKDDKKDDDDEHNNLQKKVGPQYEREKLKKDEEDIQKQMLDLEKTRPNMETFDPDYENEKKNAYNNLGEFKLKSSPKFVVTEEQRMNVAKKRKHMFLLQEFVYNTKMKFNYDIISLKDRKSAIISKIKQYNSRITEINNELGLDEILFTPSLDINSECPEEFLKVSEDEINQAIADQQKKTVQQNQDTEITNQVSKKPLDIIQKKALEAKQLSSIKARKTMHSYTTDLEKEKKICREIFLNNEKSSLMNEIEEEITNFDADVSNCNHEKNLLECDMKMAEMKLITYYQELMILFDMEERDSQLIQKLLDITKDKQNLEEQANEIQANIQQIKESEAKVDKVLQDHMKIFKELVYADDDAKRVKIHEYYRKKFKKNKAKLLKQSNEEDNDGENEYFLNQVYRDEEDSDDDVMSDEDEERPDISPIENDPKSKDIIEKIVDLEDEQETNDRNNKDLARQLKQIDIKIKQLMIDLENNEKDLRDFQKEKLSKVNKLDVCTIVKLSQIQNFVPDANGYILPNDLKDSILINEEDVYNLSVRITELDKEQEKSKKQKSQLEKKLNFYKKENDIKDEKIQDLNQKYLEKHMLKFGDRIDLKILDALEPTKQVLEARQKFKQEERESVKKVENAMNSLMLVKKKLLETKRENTKIINNITKLGQAQMQLNKKLDSTNKQLFKEENEEKTNDLDREKQNLQELVRFLNNEIEDLKTEIGLFKRKGGHIYTMVTSNKKTFQG